MLKWIARKIVNSKTFIEAVEEEFNRRFENCLNKEWFDNEFLKYADDKDFENDDFCRGMETAFNIIIFTFETFQGDHVLKKWFNKITNNRSGR